MDQRTKGEFSIKYGVHSDRYFGWQTGNKCDKPEERTVKQEEAIEFSQSNKLHYLETSALTGSNV